MKSRETFNFYRSFFEAGKDMSDTDRLAFYDAILGNSFGEETPNLIGIPKIVFAAIKPVIDNQTTNYLNGKKGGRPPKNNPPLEKENNPPLIKKESYKYKEKEKENKKDNKIFSFSLSTTKQLSNTSIEYQSKLKEHIVNSNKPMGYEEFYDSCEMKGYKYKNFKLVYDKWNKDSVANSSEASKWTS